LLGGFMAISGRRKLRLTLGFTAGLILGLVAFDLLPEIFELVQSEDIDPIWPMVALVVGFLLFHIAEKFILIHYGNEEKYGAHRHPLIGVAGAIALIGHSFLDGLSIGIGFQVSSTVGMAVALAVIGHRFADGFNTTNVMLYHQNKPSRAKFMLVIAATMPIIGGAASLLISFSQAVLAIYLGFFAGFLLYIGAGDILPQAHFKGASHQIIVATVLGVIFMFTISRLI
jgi:ZIP family zinc transporter